MKIIELRRHSKRVKSSPHLTQEGVELARKTGEKMGDFKIVISSNAPRAIETAVAMGYAVDEIHEEVSKTPEIIQDEVKWGMNFHEYSLVIQQGKKTAKYANEMTLYLKDVTKRLEEGEIALILSHGGLIEIAVIGCIPTIDFKKWGDSLYECEGVRLYLENDNFIKAEKIPIE